MCVQGTGCGTRLTQNNSVLPYPTWTPDSSTIAFSGLAGNLYARPTDLSREETLLATPQGRVVPGAWTLDGGTLIYYVVVSASDRDIWTLREDGASEAFLDTDFSDRGPRLSPDGRWLAYVSDRSGEDRVHVQAFPEAGPVFSVSAGPGTAAVWSRDGREIFYRNGDQLWVVDVELEPEFRAGSATMLFERVMSADQFGNPSYDVSLDGQQFLMVRRAASAEFTAFTLVQNWFEELKERVPVP